MHTRDLLKTSEFTFARGGSQTPLHQLLPDFSTDDRIGVLAWSSGGIIEAGPLFLAAIGAFYEEQNRTKTSFYEYPDFFALHIGARHGYHGWFDIWPERREVLLPNDPNAVLGAISDLGISRLIIQDAPKRGGILERESVTQVTRHLRTILRMGGETTDETWSVTPSPGAVDLIERAATASESLIGRERAAELRRAAEHAQQYTPIELDDALRMLCHVGPTAPYFGMSEDYRRAHAVNEKILNTHTHEVVEPVR